MEMNAPKVTESKPRRTITHKEFMDEGERRFGPDVKNWQWACPSCGTSQNVQDFYDAGFIPGAGEVNKYIGFSCVGRWHKTKGCDWTLGGLFQIHTLEVIDEEGKNRKHFDFADV